MNQAPRRLLGAIVIAELLVVGCGSSSSDERPRSDAKVDLATPQAGSDARSGGPKDAADFRPEAVLAFEAESANLKPPFTVEHGMVGQSVASKSAAEGGRLAQTFNTSTAGEYVIACDVVAETDGNNSFFVNIDAEPQGDGMIWDILELTTGGAQRRTVSWRGTGTAEAPEHPTKSFLLKAGRHELIIRGREPGALLDRCWINPVGPPKARADAGIDPRRSQQGPDATCSGCAQGEVCIRGVCLTSESTCDTSGRGRTVSYSTANKQPSKITFEFSCDGGECRCGRFATGWDYWVAPLKDNGIVTITAMKPDQTGSGLKLRNGFVIDPEKRNQQGFDGRPSDAAWGFTAPPALPLSMATQNALPKVILKAHSNGGSDDCNKTGGPDPSLTTSRTCLIQVESLTVLPTPPPNNGATVLRPPYFGKRFKLMHDVSRVDFNVLPALPHHRTSIGWDVALKRLRSPAVDYFGFHRFHESFAPAETYDFDVSKDVNAAYPGKWVPAANEPYLQLTLAATGGDAAKKRLLALRGIQRGADLYSILYHHYGLGGASDEGWGNAGYGHGRVGPIVFAATMLNKTSGTDPYSVPHSEVDTRRV